MRNRNLLGAGVAFAMAFGGVQAQAQFLGPYPPGAWYLGPEGGWTKLTSENPTVAAWSFRKNRRQNRDGKF